MAGKVNPTQALPFISGTSHQRKKESLFASKVRTWSRKVRLCLWKVCLVCFTRKYFSLLLLSLKRYALSMKDKMAAGALGRARNCGWDGHYKWSLKSLINYTLKTKAPLFEVSEVLIYNFIYNVYSRYKVLHQQRSWICQLELWAWEVCFDGSCCTKETIYNIYFGKYNLCFNVSAKQHDRGETLLFFYLGGLLSHSLCFCLHPGTRIGEILEISTRKLLFL